MPDIPPRGKSEAVRRAERLGISASDERCFYNEKVDITIDGVAVDQPTTKFS